MPIVLDSFNLADSERKLCEAALQAGGSIVEAANLLGITRHALKRRILKHRISWPAVRSGTGAEVGLPIDAAAAASG